MSGISGISGVAGISGLRLETEYAARVAKLQKDAVTLQGDLAMQLIDAAASGVGQNLNVTA